MYKVSYIEARFHQEFGELYYIETMFSGSRPVKSYHISYEIFVTVMPKHEII